MPKADALDLYGKDLPAIAACVESLGEKAYRARQIYRWLYARNAASFGDMTDLPAAFRETLIASHQLGRPAISRTQESTDGTRKYLIVLPGGGAVESVYMPEEKRVTLCISSQVGCALDCHFCLTATMGFVRHLETGEIVGQVGALLEDNGSRIQGRPLNIVMMGMGEALHNYDNSVRAVRLLADPSGFAIPRRRITLSTAGRADRIRDLAREEVRPRLAVSLNATTDAIRSRIMPINRKYPIEELMDACRTFPVEGRERITFEYVLLGGVNDAPEDPPRLASLIRRHSLRAKVNLIPFNPGSGLHYREPPAQSVRRFRDDLLALGVPTSIRRNRGRDISAACGQLATSPVG